MEHRDEDTRGDGTRYPVIVACMGEDRAPTLTELAHIAKRIRREVYPIGLTDRVQKRRIVLSALVALGQRG
ncbi:hypothetical protein WBP06_19165 [Novosphingobium sp. BL-8H]|uniref:hypothetical protein n=1 Tax=Novosphingobium sp. BL-8H TaxID=3127640 RepID=UPI003756ABE2